MNSAIVQYYVIPYFSPVFTVAFLTYFTSFGLPASMLYLNSTEFKLHYIWQFSLISIHILLFFLLSLLLHFLPTSPSVPCLSGCNDGLYDI